MNNPEHILTITNSANDKCADSSDVLSLLQVIEQLYKASRIVINSYSASAIQLSMAIELQTLLTKLHAMHNRWSIHLPFKEASSVDFMEWSSRAAQMAEEIGGGDLRYCLDVKNDIPSCHCLVDLYDQSTQKSFEIQEIESEATIMLNRRSVMQDALRDKRMDCVESISQMVTSQLSSKHTLDLTSLKDTDATRTACSSLLKELSLLLQDMHSQLVKIFNTQDYERLADRILLETEYEGPKARREAREAVVNWRNGVPLKNLDSDRKSQIELIKEEIRKTKHGVKLEQYVDLDDDFLKQRSEFGRFLFHRRREISRAELRQLILLVYSVYYYQQDASEQVCTISTSIDSSFSVETNLPTDFLQALRGSQTAVRLFVEILHKVEPYINNNGTSVPDSTPELCAHYKDWSWCHLLSAFEQMDFLTKNSSKSHFATFIHSLFPHRTEESVNRALYRNTNLNSTSIVADVMKEFKPVRSLIKL